MDRIFQFPGSTRLIGATVDEVVSNNRSGSYILVSRRVRGDGGLSRMEQLRLNIDRTTQLRNREGRRINLRDIRPGSRINATHSSRMTASIPPQVQAYVITLLTESPSGSVTVDRIIEVNPSRSYILTGNPRSPMDQVRFNVSPATTILDQNGRRIRLRDLREGQLVRIEHSDAMTRSIPPQSQAFVIRVLR